MIAAPPLDADQKKLVAEARADCDHTVVCCPSPTATDLDTLRELQVDAVFMPKTAQALAEATAELISVLQPRAVLDTKKERPA